MEIDNKAFGKLKYDYFWYKEEKITIFENEIKIIIRIDAFEGEEITKEQENSYELFKTNKEKYVIDIENGLKDYINNNIEDLEVYWDEARNIFTNSDLNGIITPSTILFNRDGSIILLAECSWDKENGLGIKFYPEFKIETQNMYI